MGDFTDIHSNFHFNSGRWGSIINYGQVKSGEKLLEILYFGYVCKFVCGWVLNSHLDFNRQLGQNF